MKKSILKVAIISYLLAFQHNVQGQNLTNNLNKKKMENLTEKTAIEKLLFSYRDALNTSDVNKVLSLYSKEGVFMPSNAPTAIGQEQLKVAYEFVFKAIQLNIEFYVDEIVQNGDYAFARTTSKGTTLIHATNQTVPEENRELFVLRKSSGLWKIDRYMFNKMK